MAERDKVMPSSRHPVAVSEALHADPFVGTPYVRVRQIGEGGMGEVFLVRHRELGRSFVAKVLRAELLGDPRTMDRVRIEAEALGRLSHPNIVSVTDVGTARGGRPFIIMERLAGQTLDQLLEARGALPLRQALEYAQALLAALAAAHQLGIVHRDIKPQNLFLHEPEPGRRVLKVLDFGMARVLPGAGGAAPLPLSLPTEAGLVMGTPRFVSPEAAVGRRVDQRADVYSAGLMLYLMAAGRGPFDHLRRLGDLLEAHVAMQPQPPSYYAPREVPSRLDAAVLKALAKRPEDRFQSADDFRAELAEIHVGLVQGLALDADKARSVLPGVAMRAQQPPETPRPLSAEPSERVDDPAAGSVPHKSQRSAASVESPLLSLALFCASFVLMALVGASLASWVEALLGGHP